MTNKDYALLAGKFLSDKKAKDIVIIDIQGKATFADYFVLCSGTSERQINTLADQLEDAMYDKGLGSAGHRGEKCFRMDTYGFRGYDSKPVYRGNERKIQHREGLGRLPIHRSGGINQ